MEVVTLSPHLLARMRRHILSCLPNEACGLVGGKNGVGKVVIPISNLLPSPFEFRMQPIQLLRALQRLESQQLEITLIYHSHPSGPPVPSLTDLANHLYPDSAVGIWTPVKSGWELFIYWIDNSQFRQIRLESA